MNVLGKGQVVGVEKRNVKARTEFVSQITAQSFCNTNFSQATVNNYSEQTSVDHFK